MEDVPHCLSSLPAEILVLIGGSRVRETGRLACTCRTLSEVFSSDAAFASALRSLVPSETSVTNARAALRSLTRLDYVEWTVLENDDISSPTYPSDIRRFVAPGSQHHACFCHGSTLIVFGGHHGPTKQHSDATWALDVRSGTWYEAAVASERPGRRSFNADAGGCGGILHDAASRAWLILFSGSRPGMRDNETWMLGPLGPAAGAASWRWHEVQADGRTQSPERPSPRFHATMTVVQEAMANGQHRDALLLYGGHNFRIEPIEEAYVLSLHGLDLRACSSGGEAETALSAAAAAGQPPSPLPPPPQSLAGLERIAWQSWDAADDGEGPEARARHTAVFWPPSRGYVVLGGISEEQQHDTSVWISRGPFVDGHAAWQELPSMHTADAHLDYCHDVPAVVLSSERLLVTSVDLHSPSQLRPVFLLLEPSPWRWSICRTVGEPPRGLRYACRASLTVVDTFLIWGGHDGSAINHFDDPQDGYFAPHEARVARLLPPSEMEPGPVLRFGRCSGGEPPNLRHSEGETTSWLLSRVISRQGLANCREVLLHGLQGRADLNGTVGTLLSNKPTNDRYQIDVGTADEKNVVLVKPANLCPGTSRTAPTITWCAELGLAVGVRATPMGPEFEVMKAHTMRMY